jgi:hypothetical protein
MACITAVVAHDVVVQENTRLLRGRTGEVGLLLGASIDETRTSLGAALRAYQGSPTQTSFGDAAQPLLTVRARAVVLAEAYAGGYRVAATLSYPGGPVGGSAIPPSRAAVLRHASLLHDFVASVVSDAGRPRLVMALGSPPGSPDRVVYQENAIDPFVPDPATTAEAFTELEVAMYASADARNCTLGRTRGWWWCGPGDRWWDRWPNTYRGSCSEWACSPRCWPASWSRRSHAAATMRWGW